MNADIQRLLEETADDTDHPMGFTPDDLTRLGERNARRRRAGVVAAALLGAAAVVTAVTMMQPSPASQVPPAGVPGQKVTVDPKTGRIIQPGPPQSPLSDEQIIARCLPLDDWFRNANHLRGSIQGWTVLLKQGSGAGFDAILISADHKQRARCSPDRKDPGGRPMYSRGPVTPAADDMTLWMTGRVPAAARLVVMETSDGKVSEIPTKEGFYLLPARAMTAEEKLFRVYDEQGNVLLDLRRPGVTMVPVR